MKFAEIRVWRIDKNVQQPLPVWLLIRKELDDSDIKYSLCNAPAFYNWDKLARMQSERYWIERSFENDIDLCWHGRLSGTKLERVASSYGFGFIGTVVGIEGTKAFSGCNKGYNSTGYCKIIQALIPLKPKTPLSIAEIIIRNHRNRKRSRRSKMKKKNRPIPG